MQLFWNHKGPISAGRNEVIGVHKIWDESGKEMCVVKEQETEVEPDRWETEEVEGICL